MIENEDSVVTSLNELRKLKNERISRQTQSRGVPVGNRAAALAEDPLADQMTPPPMQGFTSVAGTVPFEQSAAVAPPVNRFASVPAAFDQVQIPGPTVIKTKTSYTAAVVMSVLLIGAGGAGYMKLQQDTQALLAAKEASIKSTEEARMRSVEAAAKIDQQNKASLRQCEEKLKTATASAAAVAPVVPTVAQESPAVEKKAERPTASNRSTRGSRRSASRPSRQAGASSRENSRQAKEKSGEIPTIAKKKKLDNDPLSGLGKL